MTTLRTHIISLGCPKNRVDTEHLTGSLGCMPVPVDTPCEADLVFINTCGFIRTAVQESVRVIAEVIADCKDTCPKPLLVVAGCLVGRYGAATLAPELPEIDVWLDPASQADWPKRVLAHLNARLPAHLNANPETVLDPALPHPPLPYTPLVAVHGRLCSTGAYAWLKISDGCRHACSFCTIPAIRGPHRSVTADVLVREATDLLDNGVKELVLVAQDVTAWGEDLGQRHGLQSLLDRLMPLPGLDRLRLMYVYPAGLTPDLLHWMQRAGAPFVPYFDIPLQHAHPALLQRMGRPFARNPREVIDRVRTVLPEAALRTSLIVGFPGETDAHFATLLEFVREVRFQHLGVFAYQAEEGTVAATLPHQVPQRVKTARRNRIMKAQAVISHEILAELEGKRLSVLVESESPEWPGLHVGRAWFQAPEVDGVTWVSGPGVAPGVLVLAEIVEARTYDLVALV